MVNASQNLQKGLKISMRFAGLLVRPHTIEEWIIVTLAVSILERQLWIIHLASFVKNTTFGTYIDPINTMFLAILALDANRLLAEK